ncbi:MAG: IPTL-CTERM sorting domain-containing protein [Thermodesulfobacteriota bacterium]
MNTTIIRAKRVILYTSSKLILTLSVAILLCSSFFVFNQDAYSQDSVCLNRIIEQITADTTENSFDPSINSDGTWIAFASTSDINGGNPDGNDEIFLFNTTTGVFTQITDETAGDSALPSINSDGTRIAFESTSNINGGNPEGNAEIYFFDTTTGVFTQVTAETVGDSQNPSINSDGTRIAFRSRANINGGNPGGLTDEIYLFDTTSGVITQITNDLVDPSSSPSINSDGTRIAFQTRADINGGNPENNREIYLFDTTTGIFTQITDEPSGDGSFAPSINSDGTRITFVTEANINGGNPEDNFEIFLFDTTTGVFTQITDETVGSSTEPSINSDGTRIAFTSDANLTGGNPEGNDEVYLFDTTIGTTTQITDETDTFSSDPSINSDGTRIAFVSNGGMNGGNPDENAEIFLSICLGPRNVPTLSEWGLIAMAGVLGVVGFMVMRRKRATA